MIELKKNGRYLEFINPPPKALEACFFNQLSYERQGAAFMVDKRFMYIRFYNEEKHRFPYGFKRRAIRILESWKKQINEDYIIYDNNSIILKKDFKFPEDLRDYQKDAIFALQKNGEGMIEISTGGGKTRTLISFLDSIEYRKALIVVPTIFLLLQWQKQIDKNKCVVMTYQSIKPKMLKEYDVLCIDEIHTIAAASVYKIAMRFHHGKVIGATATPRRAYQPEGMKIEAAIGLPVYRISIRELINKGYLADAEIRIVEMPENNSIMPWESDYVEIYQKYIVENEFRNNKAIEIAMKESKNGLVFIMVEKIEHGKWIYEKILETNLYNTIFVSGKSKGRETIYDDIRNGDYQIVVCTRVFSLGVDFPNLKTLILASGGKSCVAVIQKIGRVLRLFSTKEKAHIYDFADSVKYLKDHFLERLEIYRENFNPYSYELGNQETI